MISRPLQPYEQKALYLVRLYERTVEARENSLLITVGKDGMFAIFKGESLGKYRTLSVVETKSEKDEPAFHVRFWLKDFEAYMKFLFGQCRIAIAPNYRLILSDGFTIEI
jgi:hypothetical protein